jgi:hypothetical protein
MTFFETLSNEQATVLAELNTFIEEYAQWDDNERMARSSFIFDLVRLNMRKKLNLLYPQFQHEQGLISDLARAADNYSDVEDVLEGLVMIHVDEPNNKYIERIVHLRDVLQENYRLESERILPVIAGLISPEVVLELERETTQSKVTEVVATEAIAQPISANR